MTSYEIKYLCVFQWGDGITGEVYIPDIQTAKDGFWLNELFEYSSCDEPVWWIPPGRVLHVHRVKLS